jgi:DNA-binding NtrC family response regulator
LPEQVLVVNADEAFRQVLQQVLGAGYVLRHVPNTQEATARLGRDETDIVLLNLGTQNKNSKLDGARQFLQAASTQSGSAPVIAYGWDHQRRSAVDALRHGAVDFLEQPLDVRELKFALDGACRRADLARDLVAAQKFSASHIEGLLGNSKAMERVHEVIHKVAGVFTSVLITGESGTGKGMVARAIHRLSSRVNKPFVESSLCTLPESLIEDELFGHEKGAFTGATQSRRGRFEEAHGGTIFLDEIGDLALPLQAKLLRVLQERTVERLGSNVAHPVDIRLVCATNRNLEKMVQEGTFREDLFFRISVVRLHLPSLRERGEDIPLLAEYFLRVFAKAHNKRQRGLTPGFLNALAQHKWPGNVRELQNVIERSLVLADGNEHLGIHDLPQELKTLAVPDEVTEGSFHAGVRSFKRELVRSALRMHMGNKLKAARELGISRCYLHRLLNQLNIDDAPPGSDREEAAERDVAGRGYGLEGERLMVRVV